MSKFINFYNYIIICFWFSQKGPDHIEPNSSCEHTAAEMRALRGVCSLVCESFFHMIVHFVTFILGVKGSGLLMMQVVSISSTVLLIGFLSAEFTYQMHVNLKKENEEIHPSMSAHIPQGEGSTAQQNTIYLIMILWYTMHSFTVCYGICVLFIYAHWYIGLSILFAYWFIFNLLRYLINGELRFFKRTSSSSVLEIIQIILLSFAYPTIVSVVPTTALRYQHLLGSTVWSFGCVTSFLIGIIPTFMFVKDMYVIGFFIGVIIMYAFVILIFILNIDPNARASFFWSRVNWKMTLRDELWESVYNGSVYWNEPSLLGNVDAHHAGHVALYLENDLPWDKLSEWLKSRKNALSNNPPIWMSVQWMQHVPEIIRNDVWSDIEYKMLMEKVKTLDREWNEIRMESLKEKTKEKEKDIPNDILQEQKRKWLGVETLVEKVKEEDDSWAPKTYQEEMNDKIKHSKTSTSDVLSGRFRDPKMSDNVQTTEALEESSSCAPGKRNTFQESILKRQRRRSSMSIESLFLDDSAEPRKQEDKTYHREDANPKLRTKHREARETFSQIFEESTMLDKEGITLITENVFRENGIDIGDSRKEAIIFMSVLLKCAAHCEREFENERHESSGVARVLISGFSEVADEVTDIVLGVLFFFDPNNLTWAGHIMAGCFIANRVVSTAVLRFACKESFQGCVESLLGVKSITDTYALVTQGTGATVKGAGTSITTSQWMRLAIGLVFESIPQVRFEKHY